MEYSKLKVFAVFVLAMLRFSESKYRIGLINGESSNLEGDSRQNDRTNYYGKSSMDVGLPDSEYKGTTLPISFSSYLNQVDQQYEARLGQGPEVIVFDKVLVNDGNGYDSTTGIFTVPISGVYFFSYAISSGVDRTIVVSLTVNGKVYSTSCADTHGVYHSTMAGNNILLTLEKGQRVLVNYDGDGAGILCSNRFGLCTFSGFLLYVA